jgi:hypothetical protein
MSIYFLTEFFKYFFRVLHEASSSRLKFGRTFIQHPVFITKFTSLFGEFFIVIMYLKN